jgi:hypothetical protein
MPPIKDPTDHEWEDLFCLGLGILILLSPGVALDEARILVMVNAAVVGLVVMAVSEFELAGHTVREEVTNGIAGLWLVASPFVFGYSAAGALRVCHFVLGGLVTLLAVAELLQERRKHPRQPPPME